MKHPPTWLFDENAAVYYSPETGRILALIEHDGHGKYHPTIFQGPFCAIRFWLRYREDILKFSFPSWSCVRFEFLRLKHFKMQEAIDEVKDAFLQA